MASELITGFAGTPHVGSDDMGAFQAGILGTGSYVLQTGQQLKATVASSNKVTIGTGDLVMNGRHVRMATATDLTIQNGTQGQKRNDLIVCRYSKASDGKETATLTVVKGTATTGTPADPSYNKTSILDGASVSDMPLYRIPITNLSVGTPIQLFKVLTPLGTVGDSVTQCVEAVRSGKLTLGGGWVAGAGTTPEWHLINDLIVVTGVIQSNYGVNPSANDPIFQLPYAASEETVVNCDAMRNWNLATIRSSKGDTGVRLTGSNEPDWPAGSRININGAAFRVDYAG